MRTFDSCELANCLHERLGTRRGAVLHTFDGRAFLSYFRKVEQEQLVLIFALVGHNFDHFNCLGPTFSTVGHLKPVHAAVAITVFVFSFTNGFVLTPNKIRVRLINDTAHVGHVVPVNDAHVIIICTTNTRTIHEQIEQNKRRGCRRTVGENFHVAFGLLSVTVLKVATRHEQ